MTLIILPNPAENRIKSAFKIYQKYFGVYIYLSYTIDIRTSYRISLIVDLLTGTTAQCSCKTFV